MQTIISYVLSPFLTALFATVGAAVPLGIIIYIYSLREKEKLGLKVKTVKRIMEHIQKEMAEQLDTANKIKDDYTQLHAKSPKDITEYTQELIKSFGWQIEKTVELARYQEFIDWAEHYNFWSVLENILEKKYLRSCPKSFLLSLILCSNE